jgi:putative sterol carrier protein
MSDMIAAAVEALDAKAKASGLSETVKFNIEGAGAVVIDGTGARASDEEADLTVTADAETFHGIMGKIAIDGDMGLAMKLSSILG